MAMRPQLARRMRDLSPNPDSVRPFLGGSANIRSAKVASPIAEQNRTGACLLRNLRFGTRCRIRRNASIFIPIAAVATPMLRVACVELKKHAAGRTAINATALTPVTPTRSPTQTPVPTPKPADRCPCSGPTSTPFIATSVEIVRKTSWFHEAKFNAHVTIYGGERGNLPIRIGTSLNRAEFKEIRIIKQALIGGSIEIVQSH